MSGPSVLRVVSVSCAISPQLCVQECEHKCGIQMRVYFVYRILTAYRFLSKKVSSGGGVV
jgi:hypothetical protein